MQKIARIMRASPVEQNSRLHYVKAMRIAHSYLLTGSKIRKWSGGLSVTGNSYYAKKDPLEAGENRYME